METYLVLEAPETDLPGSTPNFQPKPFKSDSSDSFLLYQTLQRHLSVTQEAIFYALEFTYIQKRI